jgi:hypothetical protein
MQNQNALQARFVLRFVAFSWFDFSMLRILIKMFHSCIFLSFHYIVYFVLCMLPELSSGLESIYKVRKSHVDSCKGLAKTNNYQQYLHFNWANSQ